MSLDTEDMVSNIEEAINIIINFKMKKDMSEYVARVEKELASILDKLCGKDGLSRDELDDRLSTVVTELELTNDEFNEFVNKVTGELDTIIYDLND